MSVSDNQCFKGGGVACLDLPEFHGVISIWDFGKSSCEAKLIRGRTRGGSSTEVAIGIVARIVPATISCR